jgi:hypothetical protein
LVAAIAAPLLLMLSALPLIRTGGVIALVLSILSTNALVFLILWRLIRARVANGSEGDACATGTPKVDHRGRGPQARAPANADSVVAASDALGVGAIVGTGILTLIGVGAGKAGPAVILSFLIAGAICACAALAYAEMATMIPASGSAYTYSYVVLGELIA